MKTIVIVAKNDKEWRFSCCEHSWSIEENCLIVWDKIYNAAKLILNIELFAYMEVQE